MSQALQTLRTKLHAADQMLAAETRREATLLKSIEQQEINIELHEQAIRLCESCLEQQADLRVHLEAGVTAGLRAAFDDSYEFKFDVTYKADKVTTSGLEAMVYKNGIAGRCGPGGDHGGGVMNVVSLLLLFFVAKLLPELTPFICIDEGLANVEPKRHPAILQFLQECNKIEPLQLVCVTHTDAEFPQTIRVSMPGTISVVESVSGEQ